MRQTYGQPRLTCQAHTPLKDTKLSSVDTRERLHVVHKRGGSLLKTYHARTRKRQIDGSQKRTSSARKLPIVHSEEPFPLFGNSC